VVEQSTGLDHALVSGGTDITKASAMELTAVVMGLARVPHAATVTVFTDSKYLLDTTDHHREGDAGENGEIWARLAEECRKHRVAWHRLDDGDDAPHAVRALTLAKSAATDFV
jgi:ribonuclease HI